MKLAALIAALVLVLSGDLRAGHDPAGGSEAGAATLRLAQSSLAVIDAPTRIDTDQETVDFTGRAMAPGDVTLTINGTPVPVARDGSFRVRLPVPVGRSRLLLVVEGSYGDRTEQKVFVRRTAAVIESVDFGRFHALVIGNNQYTHLTDLRMAAADAEAVAALLTERYGFRVETLIDATRYDIIAALSRTRAELTENDNLLIYYAGHGSLDVGSDEGFWLPVDAEPDIPVNWISNNDISGQLRAIRAKHVMVVADSCYSGKLTRNVEAQLKTGAERTAWIKRMNARRSRTALTSGGLEPVLDAGGGRHSVFAKAFLDALAANTEVIDGQTLFDAIKRPIVVNADQTPEYADVRKAGHDGGDFLFVPVAVTPEVAVAVPVPAPAAAIAPAEIALWQAVKDSANVADYQAYLQAYPAGVFAPLAQARIATLNAEAERRAATQGRTAELAFWDAIKDSGSAADYAAYLEQFPDGDFAPLARARLGAAERAAAEAAERERRAAEEAARKAAAEAAHKEAERKAAEEAARKEAERKAAEEAARKEAKRKSAAEAARKAAERKAAEEAERKAAARLAAEAAEAKRKAAVERAFWEGVAASDNAADYNAYLRQYPNGLFAPLAQARLAEAEREAEAKRKAAEREAAEAAEAEREAAQKTQTALLTPPAPSAAAPTREEVLGNKNIKQSIITYYYRKKIKQRGGWGRFYKSKITKIESMKILNIQGNIVTVEIEYNWVHRWRTTHGGIDSGVATLEKSGSTYYRVVKFKTGGMTY